MGTWILRDKAPPNTFIDDVYAESAEAARELFIAKGHSARGVGEEVTREMVLHGTETAVDW